MATAQWIKAAPAPDFSRDRGKLLGGDGRGLYILDANDARTKLAAGHDRAAPGSSCSPRLLLGPNAGPKIL